MDRKAAAEEILRAMVCLGGRKKAADMQMGSRGEAMVLRLVSLRPTGMTPGELREQTEVSSARIAAILRTLEEKGMLHRQADGKDRRRVRVLLTEAGRRRAAENEACIVTMVESVLERLEDEEIQCCIQVLRKLETFVP